MTAEYQLTYFDTVIRTEDGAFIPKDEANRDYVVYLQWLDAGGTPDPPAADAAPPADATKLKPHIKPKSRK